MKRGIWRRDWVTALAVVLVYLAVWLLTPVVSGIERRGYDIGVRMTSRVPNAKIAVIAIDQQSLDNIGRWPWSRDIHAQFISKIAAAQPGVIASTIFFTEPQQDRGLLALQKLKALAAQQASFPAEIASEMDASIKSLDVDTQLAGSFAKAGNVMLPMLFEVGEPRGEPDKPLPDFIARTELEPAGDPANGWPLPVNAATWPIPALGTTARGIATDTQLPDSDGVVRSVPLAVRYFDQVFPTYPLLAAAYGLNLKPQQIRLALGESISLGNVTIPISSDARFRPYFYRGEGGQPAFAVDSFYDVYSGKIPVEKYRGKIVLIGATALGVGASLVTPVSPSESPVLLTANAISALLEQHYFVSPRWAPAIAMLVVLVIGLYLTLALPRLKAGPAAMLTGGLFVLLLAVHFLLLTQGMLWVPLIGPALLLLLGHGVLTTKQYLLTEEKHQKSSAESSESNRMLGLAFQGQGQLDAAFDKFRKVELDDSLMEILYNLALDFERKRQFNKAENVYRYMAGFDAKFRDLDQKLKRARQLSETVILGGGGGSPGGTVLLDGGDVEKPMLGRYQIQKELGKGAMGVVYQGVDPKIGRVVAIKTMALSQEFEAELLDEARSRFFREAETAGRLNHPNIVTIFDAGEEHDLAYIAMEFLKGRDLLPYTKAGELLPLLEALAVVRQVAEALDYAHQQSVVHRDIKPANIMYEPGSKIVKVTDFGIARITDSSRTKTGMVLGTPSYMSPEQLSGQKIDGRSDLFSLGVMLYQMVTGALPFIGESMAELMYRIANTDAADPRTLNPRLPSMLSAIIMKAMQKKADTRFQTGAHFAAALAKLEAGLRARQAKNNA
ncbi:Serine/threonine-protein kinase PrkC [Andreprevotia sp. IGB-42]|uniref:CHASE2 domain-containing serine/threonine-protein kinase n=1 Tax=Andreprevotia sp. IGB-42 TaxID=2497473 RepID=UPI001356B259|nr:serine/threonine-protein kinase [Andreprevotia sp. IGB-42]KAF0813973.1 Serine/threonine-protein kinase PrkC [Andreprevotia sp. IGB-42]